MSYRSDPPLPPSLSTGRLSTFPLKPGRPVSDKRTPLADSGRTPFGLWEIVGGPEGPEKTLLRVLPPRVPQSQLSVRCPPHVLGW